MKLKDILNEITISRNIEIDIVGNDIMVKQGDRVSGKLVSIDISYVGMSDRIYRGRLFVDNGGSRPQQINLDGGEGGLFEFYDAVGAGRGAEARDFFKKYGVKIGFSEFDVS
jgi:hypothetical protein